MDIVLSAVTLHVGMVQAVLELLELSAEVAPLAYDGRGRRLVSPGVVAQHLLRVLELCLEVHDAVEHLVQRRHGVAPFEPGAKLRREPGGIAAQDRVRLHRDRLGLRPSGGRQRHSVRARNRSRAADVAERVFLLLDAGGTLEGESSGRSVPEVPDVPVHALLARTARVDDDRIDAAVRQRHATTTASRATVTLAEATVAGSATGGAWI